MDILERIKGLIGKVWGAIAPGSSGGSNVQPLEVTARTPTEEEQKKYHQDQGIYFQGANPPTGTPTPTATPTPTPYPTISPEQVLTGLTRYGGGNPPPIASAVEALATLGNLLLKRNPNVNPFLPAAMTLKESSGGRNIPEGSYNPLGIGPGIKYPSFENSILGGYNPELGQEQKGFRGVLGEPQYNRFFETANLADFLAPYTPPNATGNASIETQIATLLDLLSNFSFQ